MVSDTSPSPQPTTIQRHELAVYPAFAMLAGMQLDVFTPLKDGPMTAEQLANALGVRADKLSPLLYALVAAELLTVEGEHFANTAEAQHFFVRGKPTYMGGRHENFTDFWHALLQTAESIRTGVPQAKKDFAAMSPEELTTFYRSLHLPTIAAGRELVARYDFSGHHALVDIGGGSGGVAVTITTAYPQLQATVVELPSVVPITQRFLEEAGATEQVRVQAADVVAEPLTGAYDVVILRNLIQVLSPVDARQALRHIYHAMTPGGVIYIYGNILDNSRLTPRVIVLRSLIFVNVFDEGQAYTEQEYRVWVTEAGFERFERVVLPTGFSIVRACKPV